MTAIARIDISDYARKARESMQRVIDAGADQMFVQRWRINRAVYGGADWPVYVPGQFLRASLDAPMIWHEGYERSASDVLDDCVEKIAAMMQLGKDGHWSFDMNRLVALRQAEKALEWIVIWGGSGEAPR